MLVILPGLIIGSTDAHALTRSDLDELKQQINDAQKKSTDIDGDISEQKIVIQNKENTVTQKKDLLRDAKEKEFDSWTGRENIDAAQKELDDATLSLKQAKEKLITLLNWKSQYILDAKLLNSDLIKKEKELRQTTKFDISSIVKLVGIQISNNCIKMIQNNIPNNCPTYEDLAELDTSLMQYSGSFTNNAGYYHRDTAPYANSWRAYDTDPTPRIIVDPPKGMNQKIRMITIESNFDVYMLPSDMFVTNNTRIWHHGMYIERCNNAIISTDMWRDTLPEAIHQLHTNCAVPSKYTEIKSEVLPFTQLDIADTQYWKDKIWLEESMQKCKGLCFEY